MGATEIGEGVIAVADHGANKWFWIMKIVKTEWQYKETHVMAA